MSDSLRSYWETFVGTTPEGDLRREEYRRAFYTGAWAAFSIFSNANQPSHTPEESLEIIRSAMEEVNDYAREKR